jgi:hypothetical protein
MATLYLSPLDWTSILLYLSPLDWTSILHQQGRLTGEKATTTTTTTTSSLHTKISNYNK